MVTRALSPLFHWLESGTATAKRTSVWLTAVLLTLLTVSAQAADSFTAAVDRAMLSEQETLQLTLTYSPQVLMASPDFAPLRKDFDIVGGPSRLNSMRSINGQSSSSTEWTLTLLPKRTGQLKIPSLQVDDLASNSIDITVKPMSAAVREQSSKLAFFDINISEQPAYYVQGQILYTEKLYYRVNHRDADLSDLEVEDARVEPLGEPRNYVSVVDGEKVGVYERDYLIQPEKAGKLVIPGQRFQAMATIMPDPSQPWNGRRQMISAVTKPITLDVKPIPAEYPTAPWLPAEKLTLKEEFSADPHEWKVGDPITRTLVIQTQGLSANQIVLPNLPIPDGLKQYPDQSVQQDQTTNAGIAGTFRQPMALVPTRTGNITLPEVRIPWWNTKLNKLEYAVIPAKTVSILANPNQQTSNNSTAAQNQIPPPAAQMSATPTPAALNQSTTNPAAVSTNTQPGWLFWLGWALAALGWLMVIILLATRRRPAPVATETADQPHSGMNWQDLKKACESNNAAAIHQALQGWLNSEGKQLGIHSPDQLSQQNPHLAQQLNLLDQALFAGTAEGTELNGRQLLQLLEEVRKQGAKKRPGNGGIAGNGVGGDEIAGLYPS
ncbi:BatD family protein [Oceanobacter mangrovi]|uniref:BatD family protein n=1 Tax=Oceanobacter mangrovi TaxID=2862510 RepID=UPI001C8EE86A|nr:BatD family protein [Oceanobacter mangrovi]